MASNISTSNNALLNVSIKKSPQKVQENFKGTNSTVLSFGKDTLACNKAVPKDKFDLTTGCKNFIKGLVSPVTNLVKHPIISAMAIISTVAILSLCPPLIPIFLTASLVLGGLELVKSGVKFINAWKNGQYAEMEQNCKSLGAGVSATGLSLLGVKQYYKALSPMQGITQSFKDSYNLVLEIIKNRSLPAENEVLLMTTGNELKIKDLSTFIEKNKGNSKIKVIKVTDKPQKSQLDIRGLNPDESVYGNTYQEIAGNKVLEHNPQELLGAKLKNLTGDLENLNGKTLSQAFPGRRVLVLGDDSGLALSLNKSKIQLFKEQLINKFKMTKEETNAFVSKLETTDDGVELLGTNTHRNLEYLAGKLNPTNPDKNEAEAIIAKILQEINEGEGYSFNSAVAIRDVLSTKKPAVNFSQTKCQITKTSPPLDRPITDDYPLSKASIVIDDGINNGVHFSHADRSQLSRSRSAEGSFNLSRKEIQLNRLNTEATLAASEEARLNK